MPAVDHTIRLTAADLEDLDLTDPETIPGGQVTVIDRLCGHTIRVELTDGANLLVLAATLRRLADQADEQAIELYDQARVPCGGGCGTLIAVDDDYCGHKSCARRIAAHMRADRVGARV